MRRLALMPLLGAAVLLAACGYQLVRHRAGRDPVQTVSICTLANDTTEPGVELMVSRALRRAFLRDGPLRLAEEAQAADWSLSGRVRSVETAGRSFSAGVRVLEFSLLMRLELDLVASDGRRLVLDPLALAERESYLASADLELSRKNREEALRRLAVLLASRIHDEVALLTGAEVRREAG